MAAMAGGGVPVTNPIGYSFTAIFKPKMPQERGKYEQWKTWPLQYLQWIKYTHHLWYIWLIFQDSVRFSYINRFLYKLYEYITPFYTSYTSIKRLINAYRYNNPLRDYVNTGSKTQSERWDVHCMCMCTSEGRATCPWVDWLCNVPGRARAPWSQAGTKVDNNPSYHRLCGYTLYSTVS